MSDFVVAIGLVFVLEGMLYALAPVAAKKLAAMAIETDEAQLRRAGLIAAVLGVGLVWLGR